MSLVDNEGLPRYTGQWIDTPFNSLVGRDKYIELFWADNLFEASLSLLFSIEEQDCIGRWEPLVYFSDPVFGDCFGAHN